MATATETFDSRRFTVEEYHRMAEAGIFEPDERVELIRGVVRQMSPMNDPHVIAMTSLHQALMRGSRGRASVYQQVPLRLASLDSEPEPDILVMSSPRIADFGKESSRPVLVVEVADSSLQYDMNVKARLYAEAGVPEYWVVNLVERVLVVFRSPEDGVYRSRTTHGASERVAPEAWPDVAIELGELFLDEND